MGDVGSSRYEPALLPPCPTIRVLSYSNCQSSTHSISKWIFRNLALLRVKYEKYCLTLKTKCSNVRDVKAKPRPATPVFQRKCGAFKPFFMWGANFRLSCCHYHYYKQPMHMNSISNTDNLLSISSPLQESFTIRTSNISSMKFTFPCINLSLRFIYSIGNNCNRVICDEEL